MNRENLILKSKVSDIDEAKGIVTVAANAFGNVDKQGDVSLNGSFNKSLSEGIPAGNIYHYQNHVTNLLLGVVINGKESDKFLEMTSHMNIKNTLPRERFNDYLLFAEYGKTLKHSVGVSAVKFQEKGKVREVSEWKLWEFSTLTTWPANDNTPLLSIKSNIDDVELMLQNMADYVTMIATKGIHSEAHIIKHITMLEKLTEIHQILKQSLEATTESEEATQPQSTEKEINQLLETIKKIK